MPFHTQVHIQHGSQSAEVDEGLTDLILALWRRGYRTFSSCEGQPDTELEDASGEVGPGAWIGFTTKQQARVVAEHVGGHVWRPTAEDFENSELGDDDPALDYPNHGMVAFPASEIESVLAAVRGKVAVVVGSPSQLPKKAKRLPRAPRDEWREGGGANA